MDGFSTVWEKSRNPGERVAEKAFCEITHAVEISSIQNAAEAVEDLQDTVNKAKKEPGQRDFELVYAAADIFAAKYSIPERTAVEEFRKQ